MMRLPYVIHVIEYNVSGEGKQPLQLNGPRSDRDAGTVLLFGLGLRELLALGEESVDAPKAI